MTLKPLPGLSSGILGFVSVPVIREGLTSDSGEAGAFPPSSSMGEVVPLGYPEHRAEILVLYSRFPLALLHMVVYISQSSTSPTSEGWCTKYLIPAEAHIKI